jgi:membrane protease YdiL (CAAX protease family)
MTRVATTARPTAPAAPSDGGYFEQSSQPLTSLFFLFPLIVVYEVGTRWYASDPQGNVEQRICAFNVLQRFCSLWGADGVYMPAAAVIAMLLACHMLRRDRWTVRPDVLIWMLAESVMYAIPLVTLGYLFQHYLLVQPNPDNWRRLMVLSIGAGIYEELVFRLILFHVLHFLLFDVLKASKRRALPLMVVISAVLFSLYHYQLPFISNWGYTGSDPFDWQSFIFRTMAGIYFGLILLSRGFGLTAGAHASYDTVIVLLRLAAVG